MPVRTLDHVNISSSLLEQTYRFYGEVLGMDVRPVQGQSSLKHAAWVHAGNQHPVIHISRATDGPDFLGQQRDWQDISGSGRVHHVALDCDDYDAMRTRLENEALALRFNDVAAIGLRQIFVSDPNGVLIELNFRSG